MGGRSVSSQPLRYLRKMAESISEIADLVAMASPSQNREDFRLRRTPEFSGDLFVGHGGYQAAPAVVSSDQPVQILRNMAESIGNIADQEELLHGGESMSAPEASLEILRKVAESMSTIAGLVPTADMEEPSHRGEFMSPPRSPESISNLVPTADMEEPSHRAESMSPPRSPESISNFDGLVPTADMEETLHPDSAFSVSSSQSYEILQKLPEPISNVALEATADLEELVLSGESMSIALPSSAGADRVRFQLSPTTLLEAPMELRAEPHSEIICHSPSNIPFSVADGFQLAPSTPLRASMELSVVHLNETGIPDEVVIAFVEEMKRAHEFLLVRDHVRGIIKNKSDTFSMDDDDIISTVYCENKLHLFSLEDIHYFLEHYMNLLRGYPDRYIQDPYACSNPIFYLLFRTREEGYVLEKNPRAELEKLRKLTPLFYCDSLVLHESHVDREARTVTLRNVSPSVSVKDIWRLFRWTGAVEHVETHSAHECQIAYITFKTSSCARCVAQWETFVGSEKISCKSKPLLIELGYVQAAIGAESVEKKIKDASSMLVEALNEYEELHTYYSQFQSKDVEAYKKEECTGASYTQEYTEGYDMSFREGECWKYCIWMQRELEANGGYTVAGCLLHPHTLKYCRVWPSDLWATLSL